METKESSRDDDYFVTIGTMNATMQQDILIKLMLSYLKAFDKFYSWFPSFLDMFPDEVCKCFFIKFAKFKYR